MQQFQLGKHQKKCRRRSFSSSKRLASVLFILDPEGISRDVWSTRFYILKNIGDITGFMGRFPQPDHQDVLTKFEVPDYGRNYLQRLQAYFLAPESGQHFFYMACSRQCFFFLDDNELFSSFDVSAASKYTG